jgi:hypothetical protein
MEEKLTPSSQNVQDVHNGGTINQFALGSGATVHINSPPQSQSQPKQPCPPFALPTKFESFVPRQSVTEKIEKIFKSGKSRLALVGISGSGKTLLAINYLHENIRHFDLVIWLFAEKNVIVEQFFELGKKLALEKYPAKRPTKKYALEIVRYLSNEYPGKLLLCYDGVSAAEDVSNYFVSGANHKIIFTSTNALMLSECATVEIDSMTKRESLNLFKNIVGKSVVTAKERSFMSLADDLGFLPLAVAQAASYMRETGTDIVDYIKLYEVNKEQLLSHNAIGQQHEPVYITFDLSINYIKKNNPLAITMLDCCSYCAPSEIPFWFLNSILSVKNSKLDDIKLGEIRKVLKKFSLVDVNINDQSLSVHKLLSDIRRLKNKDNTKALKLHLSWFNKQLFYSYNAPNFKENCSILPHLFSIITFLEYYGVDDQEMRVSAEKYYTIGLFCLDYQYDPKLAEKYFASAVNNLRNDASRSLKSNIYRQYAKAIDRQDSNDSRVSCLLKKAIDFSPSESNKNLIEIDKITTRHREIFTPKYTWREKVENLEKLLKEIKNLLTDTKDTDVQQWLRYKYIVIICTYINICQKLIFYCEYDLLSSSERKKEAKENEISLYEQKIDSACRPIASCEEEFAAIMDCLPDRICAQTFYVFSRVYSLLQKKEKAKEYATYAFGVVSTCPTDTQLKICTHLADILVKQAEKEKAVSVLVDAKHILKQHPQHLKILEGKIDDLRKQKSIFDFFRPKTPEVSDPHSAKRPRH